MPSFLSNPMLSSNNTQRALPHCWCTAQCTDLHRLWVDFGRCQQTEEMRNSQSWQSLTTLFGR